VTALIAGAGVLAMLTAGCGGSRVNSANVAQAPAAAAPADAGQGAGASQPGGGAAAPANQANTGANASGTAPTESGGTATATQQNAPSTDVAKAQGSGKVKGAEPQGITTTGAGKSQDAGKAPVSDKAGAAQSGLSAVIARQAIFGGSAAGCKPATDSPITIGNVSTLSGLLGVQFAPTIPALRIFVQSQNACGGLNGHRIQLVVGDDQGDPATATTVGRKLINDNKVITFVGNIQPFTIDAFAKLAEETKIPVLGGDITNNTWFSNPWLFPQGAPPQAESYGLVLGAKADRAKKVGSVYCVEVPQACAQIDKAFVDLAKSQGLDHVYDERVSLTQPDFTPQCLAAQRAGVEAFATTIDNASVNRLADNCNKVGYNPKYLLYALIVGNEKLFFGKKLLAGAYVPLNSFPWMAGTTKFPGNGAMQYYQQMVSKFNPGYDTGGAASLTWQSGALLVAANAASGDTGQPTTQSLLQGLWKFKGQDWTKLGGLAPPLAFGEAQTPVVPYCLFSAVSNADNSAWGKVNTDLQCTDVRAPNDPVLSAKHPAIPVKK